MLDDIGSLLTEFDGVFKYPDGSIYKGSLTGGIRDGTGMMMWHVEDPSDVGGSSAEIETNLDFVLDGAGNAYAVWTGVNTSTNTENVYVNHAMMGQSWMAESDLLASYDLSAGNYAGNVSIAINSDGGIGIAWDQHMNSGSMSMHHVWFVENQ